MRVKTLPGPHWGQREPGLWIPGLALIPADKTLASAIGGGYLWGRFRPRPHRLVAQDGALSRRKQGFDSPWGRQSQKNRSFQPFVEIGAERNHTR